MLRAVAEQVSEGFRRLEPGFLLAPFGWAARPVADFVAADPALLPRLFELDRARMHLIALALAHIGPEPPPGLGRLLLCGTFRDVLTRALRHCPAGARRSLGRLPCKVLPAESYRHLAVLLADPGSAKLLFHADRIGNSTVRLLHGLPAALRTPALLALESEVDDLDGLAEALRLLVGRGAAPDFDALIQDLASRRQAGQLVARLRQIVARLPLPEAMPPATVGRARRLDSPGEVQALARRWQNCLAGYIDQVNDGQCAVYLWQEPGSPAACLVWRHGRFGWFLGEVKGPRNLELAPARLEAIGAAFADHGILRCSVAEALEAILERS